MPLSALLSLSSFRQCHKEETLHAFSRHGDNPLRLSRLSKPLRFPRSPCCRMLVPSLGRIARCIASLLDACGSGGEEPDAGLMADEEEDSVGGWMIGCFWLWRLNIYCQSQHRRNWRYVAGSASEFGGGQGSVGICMTGQQFFPVVIQVSSCKSTLWLYNRIDALIGSLDQHADTATLAELLFLVKVINYLLTIASTLDKS